jgi:hypothetical protein
VVAIEQNNNYIEFGEKVFRERRWKPTHACKLDCFSSRRRGSQLARRPSCVRLMTADMQRQGGKLQFLQSYHAGRFESDCLVPAGIPAAENPWPGYTAIFNQSASDRYLG